MDKMKITQSSEFFDNIARIIEQARTYVGRTADLTMCVTYFEIGRMIIEREQNGKARAEYGRGLMRELAEFLTFRFRRGFSLSTLKNAKQFYKVYAPSIQQPLTVEFRNGKSQSMISFFDGDNFSQKSQSLIGELYPFKVSWTHYSEFK
jgi:hypothetical protein